MIDIVSRYYVTRQGCADRDSAIEQAVRLGDELRARFAAGTILGFEAATLATDDDYADEGLGFARARLVAAVGDGPLVWVNVTFAAPGPDGDGLEGLVERFDLHPVVMDPWGGD